ncbi:ASCH domain-containing protein [Methanobrevibacter ruminantium]|uniref:ASCH domain-containing protein n=1 Tax=Methanobrevibacter ruminantium TaxID=83816 RepID=UPI0026F351B2|nr:ASCH domain-containing protein [Methanobrevibacter ruminantium]
MKMLKFYGSFVEPIKEGIKTSTIRQKFDGKVGDNVEAYETNHGPFGWTDELFGFLKIRSIKYIRFDEIDKEIARTEGYLHEDLLKEALYDCYDDLEESSLLYYIVFAFVEKEESTE